MSEPELRLPDLHLVFDDDTNLAKLYQWDGKQVLKFEMRNDPVRPGWFGHWGRCPRGRFKAGMSVRKESDPFGKWFTPLSGGPMVAYLRQGIGIHGGGTGLPHPLAPRQGWQVTHGCLRVQNEDNERLVEEWFLPTWAKKGTVWVTVWGK